MNGVKSLAQSALVRGALPRRRGGAAIVTGSHRALANNVEGPRRAAGAVAVRGFGSTTPGSMPERSFQATHYQHHASFAVPDNVVDELDPRNFGYRVVDPFLTNLPNASLYDEDYDLYSLHMSPTQVTCTSYYVDVLGDDLPAALPLPGNSTGGTTLAQSHQTRESEYAEDGSSLSSEVVTDEGGQG